MPLLFIGIILFILGFNLGRNDVRLVKLAGLFKIIGIIVFVAGLLSSCVVQVDAGNVGVQKLFGEVRDEVLPSGLHFINPLLKVEHINVKTQNYTMSGIHDEGDNSGDDAIRVLSSDGLEVTLDLTVLYKVIASQAPNLVQSIGPDYANVIIRPISRTRIRDNAVYYTAVDLFGPKREEFQSRIFASIEKDFKQRGLLLEQLLVRNITLPESVKATIESKINAEQESQKMFFVLEKEKQEAERKRVEAQGIADYQRIINASLTEKQLQYELIKAQKEIATSPNSKVIIMGGKGDAPFIIGN